MDYGFLRETQEKAEKAGKDEDTGLIRTGLEVYLKAIFPKVKDWVHDKQIPKELSDGKCRKRPDYRSEQLKMIVEFDGLPHYTNPDIIKRDLESTALYERWGYTVIRIPYFIQITNSVAKQMFGVDCKETLFDEKTPSLGLHGRCTPSYLCHKGIIRMAKEFLKYPEQYKVNIDNLKANDPNDDTEWSILEKYYDEFQN